MLRKLIKQEDGNIESSLVLIPLILLFLCGAQLVTTIFQRNTSFIDVQNQASTRAISGRFLDGDRTIDVISPNRLDQLKLLVINPRQAIPVLIPGLSLLLGKRLESNLNGVAVIEPR